jgi:hypothetical protein
VYIGVCTALKVHKRVYKRYRFCNVVDNEFRLRGDGTAEAKSIGRREKGEGRREKGESIQDTSIHILAMAEMKHVYFNSFPSPAPPTTV